MLNRNLNDEISEELFEKLVQSRQVLNNALALEEKFDLLLSNFLELQQEVLSLTADFIVHSPQGYTDHHKHTATLNRRVVNLLTSARLYSDQIHQHVKACTLDDQVDIKKYFSDEYDSCFEYRFMEALRNHVQHQGLAIHLNSRGHGWSGEGENRKAGYYIHAFALKKILKQNTSFKKIVLDEMPDKVELVTCSKAYISCLGRIHFSLRELIEVNVSNARDTITTLINQYEAQAEGDSLLLAIYKSANGEQSEEHQILLDWDDVRVDLVKKNWRLPNLTKTYINNFAYND